MFFDVQFFVQSVPLISQESSILYNNQANAGKRIAARAAYHREIYWFFPFGGRFQSQPCAVFLARDWSVVQFERLHIPYGIVSVHPEEER